METVLEIGIKAFIIKDNTYLALHKRGIEDAGYELPGGRMLFSETMEETLIREVREEVNLDILPVRIIDTWNYINGNHQVTGVIYLCEIIDDSKFILSQEHDAYKWFELSNTKQMNDLFRSQIEQFLSKMRK